MTDRRKLSRRTFLALTAGGAVVVGGGVTALTLQAETPMSGEAFNAFVAITPDGDIEVASPAQDLGQGAPVALAMILAEEIGAELSRVRILPAPRDAGRYGNPDFAGRMVTADSKTIAGYWPLLRQAGSEARLALVATAAHQNGWHPRDCVAQGHGVHHLPSKVTVDFKRIVAAGRLRMPGATAQDHKPPRDFTLLGTSPHRPDALDIVTGRKRFGTDVRPAGTDLAILRRGPHLGGTVVSHDDRAARAVEGVTDVYMLQDRSAVAVIARDTWAALKGARALEIVWSPAPDFDSASERAALHAALDEPKEAPVILRGTGLRPDHASAFSFYAPSLTHVLPEPLNATAEPTTMGFGVALTSATQSLDLDMRYGAQTWKTAPFLVETRGIPSGGAYGRRVLNDAVRDAAEIAKALGRPIQVIRPQLDEMIRGQVRPAAVQRLSARLGAHGELATWRHEIASDGTLSTHLPSSLKGNDGREDNTATDGAYHSYMCADQSVRWVRVPSLPTPGFLRGVSASYTVWAIEVTLERLLRDAGLDSLDWRLRHVDDARLAAVLRQVATMSGWGEAGRHLGLAAMVFRGTRVATVAEVTETRVHHVWIAVDAGQVVHRKQLLAQVEGGVVWGLSQALHESLTFRAGGADLTSLADYPMLGTGALPAIDIAIVEEPGQAPGGVGEIGVPTTVAAVCNAMEAATGRRFDTLPLRV